MNDLNMLLSCSGSTMSGTACGHRIAYRKWKETKLQPGTAGPGNILGFLSISCGPCPQAVDGSFPLNFKIAHLQLKTRVPSSFGRIPPDEGHLARLDVDAKIGWRIGRRLYRSGPSQPIVDGTVVEEDL